MTISDDELYDILGDSNGPAYRKTEERTGPPLEYVGEKGGSALLASHRVLHSFRSSMPWGAGRAAAATSLAADYPGLVADAWLAFRYGLVAYLALYNMLNLANEPGLPEQLAEMDHKAFSGWLERITAEGSVTGA